MWNNLEWIKLTSLKLKRCQKNSFQLSQTIICLKKSLLHRKRLIVLNLFEKFPIKIKSEIQLLSTIWHLQRRLLHAQLHWKLVWHTLLHFLLKSISFLKVKNYYDKFCTLLSRRSADFDSCYSIWHCIQIQAQDNSSKMDKTLLKDIFKWIEGAMQ